MPDFQAVLKNIDQNIKDATDKGKVATYIPELEHVNIICLSLCFPIKFSYL